MGIATQTADGLKFSTSYMYLRDGSNNDLVAFSSNGSVGIGTATPASRLDVRSATAYPLGIAYIEQGLATNYPTLQVLQSVSGGNANVDQGLVVKVVGTSNGSGNSFHVYQRDNSSTGLVVKGSGSVGIGTVSPGYKLDVDGAMTADSYGFRSDSTAKWYYFDTYSGSNFIGRGANSYTSLYDTGTLSMVWKNGNVGIGQNSPVTKLHIAVNNGSVHAPTSFTNNGVKALTLRTQEGDGLEWHLAHSTNGYTGWVAAARVNNTGGNWGNGYLEFTTASGASGAGNANVLVLSGTGNVGIGTVPTYKLDIQGGTVRIGEATYNANLLFGNSSTWKSGIRTYDNGDAELRIWHRNTRGQIVLATGYDGDGSTSMPTDGLFIVGDTTGTGPALKVGIGYTAANIRGGYAKLAVNGNVGIGTASPSYPLHVQGIGYFSSNLLSFGLAAQTSSNYIRESSDQIRYLSRIQGRNINHNSQFIAGNTSGYGLYNNSGGSAVGISAVYYTSDTAISTSAVPNSNGYVLKISYTSGVGSTSPGYGGFYLATTNSEVINGDRAYKQKNRIIHRIWAKIPSGRNIGFASNAYGSNGSFTWLTTTAGNDDWYEYIAVQQIGFGGSFSSTSYFYISGGSATSFDWYVAECSLIDVDCPADILYSPGLSIGYAGGTNYNSVQAGWGGLGVINNAIIGGSVGIGTTSPNEKLHVFSSSDPTIQIGGGVADGTTGGTATLQWRANNGTYGNAMTATYYKDATNDRLTFIDGGAVNVLTLKNGGNVGIGNTSPTAPLDVFGVRAGRSWHIANRAGIRLDANGTGYPSDLLFGHTAAANQSGWTGVYWSLSSRGTTSNVSNSFYFYRGGGHPSPYNSEAVLMTFTPDLKVGINTTDPKRTLDLTAAGQITFGDGVTGDYNQGIYWHSGSDYGIYKTSGGWSSPNYQQLEIRFVTGIILNPGSGSYGKSHVGVVGGLSVGDSYYTTMEDNGLIVQGSVGIGTVSPSYYLHVVGNSYIDGTYAGPTLTLGRYTGQTSIKAATDDGGYLIMDSTGGQAALNWYSSDNVSLVGGGGKVGIGTTSPTQKLHLNGGYLRISGGGNQSTGEINLDNGTEYTGNSFQIRKETANYWAVKSVTSGNDLAIFVDNTVGRGLYIKNTSGNVGIGTTAPSYKFHVVGSGYFQESLRVGDLWQVCVKNLTASGTQARRWEIARTFIDYNDWNAVSAIEIEVWQNYWGDGRKKKYILHYGYLSSNTPTLRLIDSQGYSSYEYFSCTVGSATLVSGDIYYVPIYIDVAFYERVDAIIRTTMDRTSNSTSSYGGVVWINEGSITPTNITYSSSEATYISPASNITVLGNTGSVGVGTAAPGKPLTVESNSEQILLQTSSSPTSFYATLSSRYDSAHPFALSVANNSTTSIEYFGVYADGGGANNRVAFPSGCVGIGTTSPGAKLDVYGSTYIRSNNILGLFNADNTNQFQIYNSGQTGAANANLIFTSGTVGERMRIDVNGNVGIGTTGPVGKLTVSGNGASGTYSGTLRVHNTSSSPWGSICFPDNVSTQSTANNYYLIGRGGGYGNRNLSFHIPVASDYGDSTQPKFLFASTGAVTLCTIEASTGDTYIKGSLGVGTTTPSQKLQVAGNIALTNSGNSFLVSNGYGYFQDYSTYGARLGRISFINMNSGGSSWDNYAYHGIGSTDASANFGDSISINSYNDITLRLDSNNNNPASYFRIMNNTTGNNIISYIGFDGTYSTAQLPSFVGVNSGPTTSYNLAVNGTGYFSSSIGVGGAIATSRVVTITNIAATDRPAIKIINPNFSSNTSSTGKTFYRWLPIDIDGTTRWIAIYS